MATGKEGEGGVLHECYYRCDSREHASNLTAIVTRSGLSDEKVAAYLKWCCVKYAQAVDSNGRSLIHVAASKGRLKLLRFLLNHRNVNINGKDMESGYTALHRSLFYGQIHCAVKLMQLGANFMLSDFDDLTPLDHVMKDRPNILKYDPQQLCEVYVWGANTCYNLGIGHNNSRLNPEPLGYFRKNNISVKQAHLSKFHSLFIGSDGKVWVCGLGSGGRLGLGDELTTLMPKTLKIGNMSSYSCKTASVAVNHTLLLLENGSVWSFGLNNYHQLGHYPPPEEVFSPRLIKALRGMNIVGIKASKFCSVFWTETQLYTCGLHGGQLGHEKTSDHTFPSPKLVTAIQMKTSTIEHVGISEGAMVVITSKGDIYLFRNYQCKRLTFCKLGIKKICVWGGHLNHKDYISSLQEKGGNELKIIILTDHNSIFLWQENHQCFTRCLLSLRRYIKITDIVLNKTSLLLTTNDGEAFIGEIKIRKGKSLPDTSDKQLSSSSSWGGIFLDKDNCDYIKVQKIPHIHRAVSVSSDLKGRNFAVVQVNPKMGLLRVPVVESSDMRQNMKTFYESTNEFDTLHDILIEVGEVRFPAHRYILSHSSEVLKKLIDNSDVIDGLTPLIMIENVQPQIFERILLYIYTGECDLLKTGVCPISWEAKSDTVHEMMQTNVKGSCNADEISAFEFYKQQRLSNKKKGGTKVKPKSDDPVEAFRSAANILGLNDLTKILESVYYDAGCVCCTSPKKTMELPVRKFSRKLLPDLWDVSLQAEDGTVFNAHKCILVARSEYFNCMISQGWMESSLKSPLKLSIPGNVLEILIRYLYTDDVPELAESRDIDLSSHILVIADQFFFTRLKEIAEVSLTNLINLKIAAEMLQLAVTYNANQLKQSAMEFICLNLSAVLESRSLEILDDSLLTELRDFYQSWLPCMTRRNLESKSREPDDDFVNKIWESEPVSLDRVEEEEETLEVKPSVKTFKEKTPRRKRMIESERTRNASTGSITSDEEFATLMSDPVEKENKSNEESWIKVTNHGSRIQSKNSSKTGQTVTVGSPKSPSSMLPKVPIVPKSTPINVVRPPPLPMKDSLSSPESEFVLLGTSSDKEFPALGASVPEKPSTAIGPKSPGEHIKKFVKISQKQRKKLAMQSSANENEVPCEKPSKSEFKPAWGISKIEISSMVDIIKSESKASRPGVATSSPPWQAPSSPTCSLSAIMAAERQQRNTIARIKSKPLEYTQMEDKAIGDLTLLYDISNVTDERITIRRADAVTLSPPVWVSNHR